MCVCVHHIYNVKHQKYTERERDFYMNNIRILFRTLFSLLFLILVLDAKFLDNLILFL